MPTLLEVFAYIFYFPSAVVGPSFEFSDFISFVRLEGAYKNIPKNLAFYNAAVELLISFSMMAVYVLMVGVFDPLYCSSKEFAAESLFYKYFYMNVAMSVQRAKYYTCWKMAQAGVIFCGLSYNPTKRDKQTPSVLLADGDGGEYEHKFDKIENVVISEVELNPNSKKKIQYWNRTVHLWLKYNLYLRILATGKSNSVASLAAFMVSAFWHGFYPVYYIFFFLFYIFEQVNDMLDKLHFFHYLESLNPVLHYTAVMLFTSMCNYLGITFVNLTVIRWYEFTRQLYFIPLIAIFGMYAICSALLSRKRREKQKD